MMKRRRWAPILEYLLAAAGAALAAWILAGSLGSPLWGGLTSFPLK
jgi:hypothetical protein